MKVLWISNVIFPEACEALNIPPPVGGGWMHSCAKALLESNDTIELAVVSLYSGSNFILLDNHKITYFLIPNENKYLLYNSNIETHFRNIYKIFYPDIVHIHGSEYPHTLAWINACGNHNVVVSIQGLVSVYANHYYGGIPIINILKTITFRDILRRDSLFNKQLDMLRRGQYERTLMSKVNNAIGRTSWDKAHIWSMNPKCIYHTCNETLRDPFYDNNWNYNTCNKYSIFLSQAHYPIKGLQQVIKALPIILKHFPETSVQVAGINILKEPYFKRNGFAKYISQLFAKFNVQNKFNFLGPLNEVEMAKQYAIANVFVCPSSIENSPNSIGEAQLVGTPCIGSYVGGTMDMIDDEETGFLYRFEETELLAKRICEIFSDPDLATKLSAKARKVASKRHDKIHNVNTLSAIYSKILIQ